ncbi:hypothetical protein QP866_10200 [Corynebacterium imitans]|uniref:hypothetical protein n=1 Tax=Corynebacterium imitans TaxID=156978 RepID=UPI00254D3D2C|nr:hypothetical protein [Corynebacterium imitans]MDK8306695.1 hypothetical protein [Corynebacterium imitans]MDK8638188.1 hypothetical protein [Corynebacterium imitans]MDK8773170.1 hypothetical protein [Corynebacterium imitans]
MGTATVVGIGSIAIGFCLIAAAFWAMAKMQRPMLALGFGIAAFVFITIIPVFLAVFVAAPGPS